MTRESTPLLSAAQSVAMPPLMKKRPIFDSADITSPVDTIFKVADIWGVIAEYVFEFKDLNALRFVNRLFNGAVTDSDNYYNHKLELVALSLAKLVKNKVWTTYNGNNQILYSVGNYGFIPGSFHRVAPNLLLARSLPPLESLQSSPGILPSSSFDKAFFAKILRDPRCQKFKLLERAHFDELKRTYNTLFSSSVIPYLLLATFFISMVAAILWSYFKSVGPLMLSTGEVSATQDGSDNLKFLTSCAELVRDTATAIWPPMKTYGGMWGNPVGQFTREALLELCASKERHCSLLRYTFTTGYSPSQLGYSSPSESSQFNMLHLFCQSGATLDQTLLTIYGVIFGPLAFLLAVCSYFGCVRGNAEADNPEWKKAPQRELASISDFFNTHSNIADSSDAVRVSVPLS
ncbi:MAG: hypothetical protein COY58_03705 [Gammaproteobacteria bacterium CG_4_10_14_0_8_um_filter_38_16]|nr:MAG: hypothetical protein COY58_03705 [Gammaproteobacteria bacterium CG_4_10_14_0_8_um_filter_38_16]PJA03685.1 MAG: hypothetical protein COX72_04090 [Gammaproteobacteria bacterium CG_4_10_14_0_2_um_filter_38_22]PJB11350.1 MAG: hypothetical protein CO120_00895 [Gammaproteobacteria bacterium CG_4_9_14_3_um_filter_38_9]